VGDEKQEIVLREFRAGDEDAFRRLNEEWITRFFKLEPKDLQALGDPQHSVLDMGGRILFAFRADEALGCCALLLRENGVYEVGKMAVTEAAQGHGVGRRVMEFAIGLARELGAKGLYLETNHALTPAIRLYRSVGFADVPAERVVPSPYERADVFMEMAL
jgi:putative acetyltransferase